MTSKRWAWILLLPFAALAQEQVLSPKVVPGVQLNPPMEIQNRFFRQRQKTDEMPEKEHEPSSTPGGAVQNVQEEAPMPVQDEGSWSASSGEESGAATSVGGGFAGGGPKADVIHPRPRPLGSGGFLSGSLPELPPLPAATASVDRNIEPGEILIASGDLATAQTVAQAMRNAGYGLLRRKVLKGLGMVLSVFRVPAGQQVTKVVEALRAQSPDVWLDANHRYRPQGAPARYAHRLLGWRSGPDCGAGRVIGLADGPVNREHPALRGRLINVESLLGVREKTAPADHGTALAGLLVGAPGSGFDGLLPAARLELAVVLRRGEGDRVDTTAEKLVTALDRFARKGVPLAVLSLGGPPNRLVELAVLLARQRGMTLVAAAGNTPGSDAVYPAAYEGVVGVAAVDALKRPMAGARRGAHIDLAAPGVDLWVAASGGGGRYRTGTSYAVPFVAAALLLEGKAAVFRNAEDLGSPGRDDVFGLGLVRSTGCGH